ncbi:B3 domain-containing transcription factor VRN1 [Linum perenne]
MDGLNDDNTRFFRIILQTTIDNGCLMIPTSFSREHFGEEDYASSPTAAILRTPNGLTWDVEILKTPRRRRSNNQPEFWILGNAWEQFVSFNRLKHGHFAVFQYEGNSLFSVFVFGISTCEITYPSERVEEAADFQNDDDDDDISVEIIPKKEEEAECDDDDVSVEILPDSDAGPSSVPEREKEAEQFEDVDDEDEVSVEDDDSVEILSDSESGPCWRSTTKQSKKARSLLNHQPSFSVVVRQTYLRRLVIPREFGRTYLKLKEQTLKLQVANCKQKWIVQAHKVKGRDEMHIIRGWSDFVKANLIQIEDVCEFEVIGVDENGLMVLQVSTTRRNMK